MPPPEKTWGVGIEHELVMFKDDGDVFNELDRVATPRGGYRATHYVFTSDNKIVDTRRGEPTGEKLVNVGTDYSVGTEDGGSTGYTSTRGDDRRGGTYELATLGPINKTVEHQIRKLRKAEKYIGEKNQAANPNHRVRYMPFTALGTSNEDSGGSYHFHFTLPHSSRDSTSNQIEKVKKWIGNIQWIEPLLISATHGLSPRSIGDKGKEPEGSIRMVRNHYGNPGGTNVDAISEDHFPGRSDSSNFPTRNQTNHFSQIAKISDIEEKNGVGDIVKSGVGGPATMEIRVFDQFDSKFLEPFLKAVVYAGSNGADRGITVTKKAGKQKEWNEAMARVLEEGWNAHLPTTFIKTMRKQLGLSVARSTQSVRAIDVMEETNKDLWELNKNNEIPKIILETQDKPEIYPVNRDAWAFYFRRKLRVEPSLNSKFKKFMTDLATIDAGKSQGFINAGKYDDAHKGLIHLVHKRLGEGYSFEDVRDILDFMELEGLIKIKRSANGSISLIKPLFSVGEIEKKLSAISGDTRYFKDESTAAEIISRPSPQPRQTRRRVAGSPRRFTVAVGDKVRITEGAELSYVLENMSDEVARAQRERLVGEVIRRFRGFSTRRSEPKIMVKFEEFNFRGVILALDDLEYETLPARRTPAPVIATTFRVGDWVRFRSNALIVGEVQNNVRANRVPGKVVEIGRGGTPQVRFITSTADATFTIPSTSLEPAEAPAPIRTIHGTIIVGTSVVIKPSVDVVGPLIQLQRDRTVGSVMSINSTSRMARVDLGNTYDIALSDLELSAEHPPATTTTYQTDDWVIVELPSSDVASLAVNGKAGQVKSHVNNLYKIKWIALNQRGEPGVERSPFYDSHAAYPFVLTLKVPINNIIRTATTSEVFTAEDAIGTAQRADATRREREREEGQARREREAREASRTAHALTETQRGYTRDFTQGKWVKIIKHNGQGPEEASGSTYNSNNIGTLRDLRVAGTPGKIRQIGVAGGPQGAIIQKIGVEFGSYFVMIPPQFLKLTRTPRSRPPTRRAPARTPSPTRTPRVRPRRPPTLRAHARGRTRTTDMSLANSNPSQYEYVGDKGQGGWFSTNKDGEQLRVEKIRHKLAAIRGHRNKKKWR